MLKLLVRCEEEIGRRIADYYQKLCAGNDHYMEYAATKEHIENALRVAKRELERIAASPCTSFAESNALEEARNHLKLLEQVFENWKGGSSSLAKEGERYLWQVVEGVSASQLCFLFNCLFTTSREKLLIKAQAVRDQHKLSLVEYKRILSWLLKRAQYASNECIEIFRELKLSDNPSDSSLRCQINRYKRECEERHPDLIQKIDEENFFETI